MWKLWSMSVALILMLLPQIAPADGINAGLTDQTVVPTATGTVPTRQPVTSVVRTDPTTGQPLIFGSNQVGRPGVAPDQIGGYDVNIAYDHVAVAVGIVAVLFLMTEWMDVR